MCPFACLPLSKRHTVCVTDGLQGFLNLPWHVSTASDSEGLCHNRLPHLTFPNFRAEMIETHLFPARRAHTPDRPGRGEADVKPRRRPIHNLSPHRPAPPRCVCQAPDSPSWLNYWMSGSLVMNWEWPISSQEDQHTPWRAERGRRRREDALNKVFTQKALVHELRYPTNVTFDVLISFYKWNKAPLEFWCPSKHILPNSYCEHYENRCVHHFIYFVFYCIY